MAKDIVNGVLITSLIFFISVFIPIIGFFGALFIPLPILFYRLKLGRKNGALVPVISGSILYIVIGGMSADVLFFAELLLIGFMLGELIALNYSIDKIMLYTTGTALISGFGGLVFYSTLTGEGIYALLSDYVTGNLNLTMVLYQGCLAVRSNRVHKIERA